jgi:hypothetical protein
MVEKISAEDFERAREEVVVEVLTEKEYIRTPEDAPISNNIEENYRNLALKLTKRANIMLDNDWADSRSISQHTVKVINSLSTIYDNLLKVEDRRKSGKDSVLKMSHSQIQQKLRQIEHEESKRNKENKKKNG